MGGCVGGERRLVVCFDIPIKSTLFLLGEKVRQGEERLDVAAGFTLGPC